MNARHWIAAGWLRRSTGFRRRRGRALVIALLVLGQFAVLPAEPAQAWKPYTHNVAGDNAYSDAVDDCSVTVERREYNLHPRVCEALRLKRGHYNAGVVGPDGYPDIVMGQAVIHPGDDPATPEDEGSTGKWLRWVLAKAWAAQTDTDYSNDEQLEILAFAYGFLTHAVGDMWGHTLVNDFAQGVFPAVAEIPTDPVKAKIALRHIIVEAYIGDATPGFDGNPDRTTVPGTTDVSDDATPAIAYAVPPNRFIWEVFVGRQADASGNLTQALPGQPTAARGALIEFFYSLRDDLNEKANTFTSLQDALNNLKGVIEHWEAVLNVCDPSSGDFDTLDCIAEVGTAIFESGFSAIVAAKTAAIDSAVELVVDAYLREWVDDIDEGLQNWSNVGNAFTAGLFDPGTRRAYQNEKCSEDPGGDESAAARIACENGVGMIGTLLDTFGESFTTRDPRLLSMLGLPDPLLFGIEATDEIEDALDSLIDLPGIEDVKAELKQYLERRLLDAVNEALGVDVEELQELLKNPASYLDAALPSPPFPPGLVLFNFGDHGRLDRLMGLPDPGPLTAHHAGSNRLEDDVELTPADFPPLENTIVTSKLVLLAGDELNRVLGDVLGREVRTYTGSVTNNIMIDALGDGTPWLRSIDGDHAWRQDGLPVFCDEGTDCSLARSVNYTRPQALRAGTGKMPIWESCVLRPAFGALFTDWENGATQWPALGDGVSADPASDDWAPRSYLDRSGAYYVDPGTGRQFVGGDNVFTITARDDVVANRGFADNELGIRYRVTTPDGAVGAWLTVAQGSEFSLTSNQGAGDGKYVIEVQAEDPCHTFAPGDGLDPAGPVASFEYWLDTTPPKVTFDTPPFGMTFDTDDYSAVDYEVDDGPNGSGVASESSTIDGYQVLPGVVATSDGAVLDMYQYYPGARTVTVTATDNIGNKGNSTGTFRIEATPDSLISNLNRARSEGKVPYLDVYNGLMDKLVQVKRQHEKRKHETEWNNLDSFIEQLDGQRDKGIDRIVANRFIAYAQLRIDLRQ